MKRATHRLDAASRFLLIAAAALVAMGSEACGAKQAPERPIAKGKVLTTQRFAKSAPSGWRFDRGGVWSVRGGRLHAVLPAKKQEKSFAFFGSEDWQNYAVEVDVLQVRGVDKGIAVRVQGEEGVGVDLRGGKYQDILLYRGFTQLGKAPAPNRAGRWYTLRVEVRGNRYRVFVGKKLAIEVTDEGNKNPTGGIALAAYTGGAGQCEVMYDNVIVSALP